MGKCVLKTFSLESDQSLPLELAKHNPYGRPEVVIGVSIDHEHRFSSKVASLDRRGGGQNRGFDGASKKSSTRVKKHSFSKKIGSGCSSDGVCIPLQSITVRNEENFFYKKIKNGHT